MKGHGDLRLARHGGPALRGPGAGDPGQRHRACLRRAAGLGPARLRDHRRGLRAPRPRLAAVPAAQPRPQPRRHSCSAASCSTTSGGIHPLSWAILLCLVVLGACRVAALRRGGSAKGPAWPRPRPRGPQLAMLLGAVRDGRRRACARLLGGAGQRRARLHAALDPSRRRLGRKRSPGGCAQRAAELGRLRPAGPDRQPIAWSGAASASRRARPGWSSCGRLPASSGVTPVDGHAACVTIAPSRSTGGSRARWRRQGNRDEPALPATSWSTS